MATTLGGGGVIAAADVVIDSVGSGRRRRMQGGGVAVDFHVIAPVSVATQAASLVVTLAAQATSIDVRGERPNTAAPQGKAGSRVLKQCLSSALSAQQHSSCLCRSLRFHGADCAVFSLPTVWLTMRCCDTAFHRL